MILNKVQELERKGLISCGQAMRLEGAIMNGSKNDMFLMLYEVLNNKNELTKFKQSEMAKHYGKDPATITRWKKSQPEIYKAMKYYYENVVMDHIKEKA